MVEKLHDAKRQGMEWTNTQQLGDPIRGMVICGGLDADRYFADVHVLSLPGLTWTSLSFPLAPSQPLARHGHGMACISRGEIVVYGGYAGATTKLGRTLPGGFAPNRGYFLQHSTPAAHAAAVGAGVSRVALELAHAVTSRCARLKC